MNGFDYKEKLDEMSTVLDLVVFTDKCLQKMAEEIGNLIRMYLHDEFTPERSNTVNNLFAVKGSFEKASENLKFMREYYKIIRTVLEQSHE